MMIGPARSDRRRNGVPRSVPVADLPEDDHREQRQQRAPGDARLAVGDDEKRRQQRTERRAEISTDLKDRLREAVPSAGGHARHARRLRMKHRRPDAHQPRGEEHDTERRRARH